MIVVDAVARWYGPVPGVMAARIVVVGAADYIFAARTTEEQNPGAVADRHNHRLVAGWTSTCRRRPSMRRPLPVPD